MDSGNHDGDSEAQYVGLFESGLSDRNINGKVCAIDGIRVAGLGGVFRHKIWDPSRGVLKHRTMEELREAIRPPGRGLENAGLFRNGLPIRHHVSIWPETYDRLAMLKADVLVTHEAPECHPRGFRAIGQLAETMGATMLIHGHHHENYTGRTKGGIRVVGVSLAGMVDDKGCLVFEGDKQRP